jgi:phosphoserine / homoserine phosphotransferase
MKQRIAILKQHNLTLKDIQSVIAQIKPLEGAKEMLDWIRSVSQIVIVSDTFIEFASPLMAQLDRPNLFCNHLTVDKKGMVIDYNLRQKDQKREVVKALKSLQYTVVAFGDSYNDISMLKEAHQGILFRPPQNVIDDCPQFPVVTTYSELREHILKYL